MKLLRISDRYALSVDYITDIDLKTGKVNFVGGGSLKLRPEETEKIRKQFTYEQNFGVNG